MNRLVIMLSTLLALAAWPGPSTAKADAGGDFRLIRAGGPLQLRADRAYILLRIDTSNESFAADLLRVPSEQEMASYSAAKQEAHAKAGAKAPPLADFAFDYSGRANLYELPAGKWFAQNGKTNTVLAEVPPGDYVFYGQGFNGYLYECMCLGSVGFAASAGKVTDIGTMFVASAAKPSPIPELAGEVDLGPTAAMDNTLWAIALRPARPEDNLPEAIYGTAIAPAQFHAVGTFVEPNVIYVNRLAPIPGVLSYRSGHVIDVATGTEVPDH